MGLVKPLLGLGVGLIGFGFYWALFEDFINRYIAKYILHNEYYTFSDTMWHGLPIICVLVGIASLILAGVLYGRSKVVTYE